MMLPGHFEERSDLPLVRVNSVALVASWALTITTAACNQRQPIPPDPVEIAPSPVPPPAPAPTPVPLPVPGPAPLPAPLPSPLPTTVTGLVLDPPALFGGPTATGAVVLSMRAPAGGAVVSLTSSDAASVTVPVTVTVPEGADRVGFKMDTRPVSADRNVVVRGSAPAGAASNTLVLWSPSPTFIAWYDELGTAFGSVGIRHLTSATATFIPFHTFRGQGQVELYVTTGSNDSMFATFTAPPGEALHVGVYEIPQQSGTARAQMDIFSSRRGCRQVFGRFEVKDVAFGADARPERFDAVFEERCGLPASPAVRGAVRFTAGR